MRNPAFHPRPLILSALLLALTGAVTTLAGCGAGTVTQSATGALTLSGHVHGGVQPVSGSTIELMAVGTAGNGSLANNILTQPVYTNAAGAFSLTGDYTCTSSTEQLYLVAKGGNPGLVGNVDNTALVLLSALGSCDSLIGNANAQVWVNEVSTVAAVYALAPFMSAYDHIGASATNTTGLANAFLDAQLLANIASGQANTLPSNLQIEEQKLYALADVIAACANSTGGEPCTHLFAAATPTGGTAPSETAGALLNIVRNPGFNVSGVFNQIPPNPPFPDTLTAAPHDWTMSLTVNGGGLYNPTGLAVDQFGNVWVANFGGPALSGGLDPEGVVAYSPQGTPLSGSPFATNANLTEVFGLTLDRNGDVWITSEENIAHGNTAGSIAKLQGAETSAPGALVGTFFDDTLDYPESIASDPGSGTILVGNFGSSSATLYNLDGTFHGNVGAGYASHPTGITSDGNGGVWLANEGATYLTHVTSTGAIQQPACCYGPWTVKLDPQGNVWATNYIAQFSGAYTFSETSSSGAPLLTNATVPGLYTPGGASIDAGGQFWVLNYHNGTFLEIAGNSASVPVGTELSAAPLGGDANLVEPYAIVPDASGNLWVSNSVENNLVMFFGLATPTATPATPKPVAP